MKRVLRCAKFSDYTGFAEMMDGRVKTLHPKIHGGILGRRGIDDTIMVDNGIAPIDLVVVNLYPFSQAVSKADCSFDDAIENIDIGGPTMVRAAAKNHADVAIVVNPNDYQQVLTEMAEHQGGLPKATRFDLAIKAFEHTAAYDGAIANHFGKMLNGSSIARNGNNNDNSNDNFPRTLNLQFHKKQALRYGENPHQQSAFYVESNQQSEQFCIANVQQLQGKELSYNNIADTDAAMETVRQFNHPACAIVKHANPCGVAESRQQQSLLEAYQFAYSTDPESAFGGIIAFNQELDVATATAIIAQQFVEVIVAPAVAEGVETIIASKNNVRLLIGNAEQASPATTTDYNYKRVKGGLLVQDRDNGMVNIDDCQVVSQRLPSEQEKQDMLFAWKVAKMVKSNAIIYAREGRTIGVGAGQMSRINSARIASIKADHANLEVRGSVMASDAFFPFRDGIDNAAESGISCIIQPGGSMRDQEVIDAANQHNMVMMFTNMRHFNH